jgi:hypothetical protein
MVVAFSLTSFGVNAHAATDSQTKTNLPSLEQIDTNHDSVLTRAEWKAKLPNLAFDRLDADHDGYITSFEYYRYSLWGGGSSGSTGGASQPPSGGNG